MCAVSYDKNAGATRILVASADGYLYIYDLNVNEGGECTLIKQHTLDDSVGDESSPSEGNFAPSGKFLSHFLLKERS